jgi:glycosyltransferase involved in cell wall biosynthesis
VADSPDKVHLLMFRADGGGGVARTVVNLANELVKTRPVAIISLFRLKPRPSFRIDPRVEVTWLFARRPRPGTRMRPSDSPGDAEDWELELDLRPSTLIDATGEDALLLSAFTDRVLATTIQSITEGILVSTRPGLHVAAVRHARPEVVVVGQDHLNFPHRSSNPKIMAALSEAVPLLDSFVVLTRDDEVDYRAWAPAGSRIDRVPNGYTNPTEEHGAALQSKVVVSAGRFVSRKGFPRLVQAWAPLAEEFPDWQLHIYGHGEDENSIRRAIARHGVADQVVVKGYSKAFDQVLLGSSAYAMGSTSEGFPMVLVEAMGKGLPLVAFDCPRGPADMIDDGVNGRLVPDGDIAGYTQALREVIGDRERRLTMGAASLSRSREYEMANIAARWSALFDELAARRASGDGPERSPRSIEAQREAQDMTSSHGSDTDATVVVVAGSGRSGTSTIAGVLKTIGLRVPPPEVKGDRTNPRGFFEPRWVVDFQTKLLRRSDSRLTDARPSAFDATAKVAAEEDTRRLVAAWLRGHVTPGAELVVKDPRSSWFLPMWRQAATDAGARIAFLTMLRHPAEVVGSKDHYYKAAKAGDTPRHAQTRGAAGWINVALHTESATRDARRTFVRYNDLLEDWRAVVDQVSRDLDLKAGRELDAEVAAEVDAFVDPGLRRIRTGWDEVDCPPAVRDLAQQVWEELSILADNGGFDDEAQRRLDECRDRYEELYGDAEALAQSSVDSAVVVVRREARRHVRHEVRKARAAAKRRPAPQPPPASGLRRARQRARHVAGAVRRRLRRS